MDGKGVGEVAGYGGKSAGSGRFGNSVAVAGPSGDKGCGDQGGTENADPEGKLACEFADVLFTEEVFSGPPHEGPEEEDDEEDGSEGDGADALAAGFLLLNDAEGGEDDAAGAIADGTVAVGLMADEGREDVRTGVWTSCGTSLGTGLHHTISGWRRRRSSLGLMAAIPR